MSTDGRVLQQHLQHMQHMPLEHNGNSAYLPWLILSLCLPQDAPSIQMCDKLQIDIEIELRIGLQIVVPYLSSPYFLDHLSIYLLLKLSLSFSLFRLSIFLGLPPSP